MCVWEDGVLGRRGVFFVRCFVECVLERGEGGVLLGGEK